LSAALGQVVLVVRQEAEDEAVRLARVVVDRALGAADVLGDPEVAVRVVLDALKAAPAEDA
jgi:hypothetical protein